MSYEKIRNKTKIKPFFYYLFSGHKENLILYGGGWNTQPDPAQTRKAPIKPHYQYYGLEATENPWRFKVKMAPQRIPAPSPNFHKGKFYNCMMNIEENRVMVVGGRPGQFFDVWDDKTFVYEWQKGAEDISKNGKWIGTDGSRLDDSTDGCKVKILTYSKTGYF